MTGKITKLIFNLLKPVFAVLFYAVILVFIPALILSLIITHPPKPDCLHDREIYITTNGVHLDNALPVKNIEPEFLDLPEILRETIFVSIGWGDWESYICCSGSNNVLITSKYLYSFGLRGICGQASSRELIDLRLRFGNRNRAAAALRICLRHLFFF